MSSRERWRAPPVNCGEEWLRARVGAALAEQFLTLWRRSEFERALAEPPGFWPVGGLAETVGKSPLKFGELRRGRLLER